MKTIKFLSLLFFGLIFFTMCMKEDEPALATLTTVSITNITVNSAESGGIITV